MARRMKRREEIEDPDEPQLVVQLAPNQIVAYNLAQARLWKNWTQEEAATELEPYLGARWSKASFSAAERSVDGQRVRQFSADEIVAFSRCFGLPVGFFFLPPPPSAADLPVRLAAADNPLWGITPAELIDVVLGSPGELGMMAVRVEDFFRQISSDLMTDAQRAVRAQTEIATQAVVTQSLDQFEFWRNSLTTLINQLESWEHHSRLRTIAEEDDDA